MPEVEIEILHFHNILNSSFRIVGALNSKNRPFFNFSVLTISLVREMVCLYLTQYKCWLLKGIALYRDISALKYPAV